jgi:ABC-2 type transport system ATP-binding protein
MRSNDTQPFVRLSGVAKRFGQKRVLNDVSFVVPAGSITGFIGVNGAGKSTTLKCIMGILKPDAGEVSLFGETPDFETRSRIGFLAEERGLCLRDRVRDVIAFHAELKGATHAEALQKADALLERIGLQDRGKSRVGSLSKGNAQRIQLLCALAHGPSLLVLDEPFSGLDPVGQSEIQTLFSEHRASGGSILLSTHGMPMAEKLCDRVVILSGGRAVFEGGVAEATALAPHGAYVSVDDDQALIEIAAELGGHATPFPSKIGATLRWQVQLPQTVPYVSLVRALAMRQIGVHAFQPIEASLEGAFWSMAKEDVAGGPESLAEKLAA